MWYGADAATMEKIADSLGLKEDADEYGRLHDRIREWIRETRKFNGGLKEVTEQVSRDIEYIRNIMSV